MDERQMSEAVQESSLGNQLPEAPLSVHIDAYYQGFHAGITIRKEDNKTLPVTNIKTAIDQLIQQGFQPSWNPDTNLSHSKNEDWLAKSGKKCKICGSEADEKEGTNKNGKPYHALFCKSGDKEHTQWLPVGN